MATPTGTVSLNDLANEFADGVTGLDFESYQAGDLAPRGWSEPSPLYTKKAFYSWADIPNENIVDIAKLTSSSADHLGIGAMSIGPSAPTNYSDEGVLLENTTGFHFLAYNPAYLLANGLIDSGFTLHYELEVAALSEASADASFDTRYSLGGLWANETKRLEFSKPSGSASWSSVSGNNPVLTTSLSTVQATHANIDLSFTKLPSGYRLDVYIDHTLWFSETDTGLEDSVTARIFLLLGGTAGLFGPRHHGIGRIRNALLINGPVDLTLNEAHCATIGDSNLGLLLYQVSPQPSEMGNNPLVVDTTGPAPSAEPQNIAALNQSGNVYLASELYKKGISPLWDGQHRINNLSKGGWSIQGKADQETPQSLEVIIDGALALSPPPKYWFCNMGANDAVVRYVGTDLGFSDVSEWATHIVDLYIVQINRILTASADNIVCLISPAIQYIDSTDVFNQENPLSFTNADNLVENASVMLIVRALVQEMDARLPHVSDRVFYHNILHDWSPSYHVITSDNDVYGPQIHFNVEGNRQQVLGLGAIIPDNSDHGFARIPKTSKNEIFTFPTTKPPDQSKNNLLAYRDIWQESGVATGTNSPTEEMKISGGSTGIVRGYIGYSENALGSTTNNVIAVYPYGTVAVIACFSVIFPQPFLDLGYRHSLSVDIYGQWLTYAGAPFKRVFINGHTMSHADADVQDLGNGGTRYLWFLSRRQENIMGLAASGVSRDVYPVFERAD